MYMHVLAVLTISLLYHCITDFFRYRLLPPQDNSYYFISFNELTCSFLYEYAPPAVKSPKGGC